MRTDQPQYKRQKCRNLGGDAGAPRAAVAMYMATMSAVTATNIASASQSSARWVSSMGFPSWACG
jgi:hypothetical protein